MMEKWETLPGETPIDDISGLKLKEVRTRKQSARRGRECPQGDREVPGGKAKSPPGQVRPHLVLKLHAEMFGDVWEWAGKPRQVDLNIGVAWYQVEADLQNLVDDLEYWEKNWPDVLEQAVHLHHRAVHVHPFMNGNGRWARMLANVWLRLHDFPVTEWPEEAIGAVSPVRNEYLAAIMSADNGEMEPLLDLHRRFSAEVAPDGEGQ